MFLPAKFSTSKQNQNKSWVTIEISLSFAKGSELLLIAHVLQLKLNQRYFLLSEINCNKWLPHFRNYLAFVVYNQSWKTHTENVTNL